MKAKTDLSKASDFMWRTARLLERHLFAFMFQGGSHEPVLAALRPYQNSDGGFGHALEPDMRGPVSQPLAVWSALRVLDEIDTFNDPMRKQACDYLLTITTEEGGVPFALPSLRPYPRVPWLQPDDKPLASINPTAGIAGLLHKHHIEHPWLETATAFCWQHIEAGWPWMKSTTLNDFERASAGYDVRATLPFLEYVPDRQRAEAALKHMLESVFAQQIVALDPAATGDIHTPLDFAPRPDSLARHFFSDAVINAHLDALANAQQEDGGWPINWLVWTPAAELEWRGYVSIDALAILQAYNYPLLRKTNN